MIAPLGSKHEIAVVWWQQQHHLLELYFSTYVINIYLENSQHSKIRIKVQFVEIALITFKYLKINILWRFIEPSSSDEPYRLKKEFSKNVEFSAWGNCTMYDFHNSTDTLKVWTDKLAINKTFFFHPIMIVVHMAGNYNFTKFHQNQMKNKNVL